MKMQINPSDETISRITHPLLLVITAVIPQIFLFLYNLHFYSIVSGDLNEQQISYLFKVFYSELALFLFYIILLAVSLIHRRRLTWPVHIGSILLSSAYLWIATMILSEHTPNIPEWVASGTHLFFFQFICVMPSIIHAIISLSLVRLEKPARRQIISLIAIVVGVPAFWFGISYFVSHYHFISSKSIIIFSMVIFGIITTVALYGALFRLLFILWKHLGSTGRKRAKLVMTLIFGLCGPIGGLILNRKIAFPANFQYWQIYAIAIINFIFLALPRFNKTIVDRIIFFARASLFSFTLYFFIIFLPFLPLSVPAIIVAGAGFLVLTPSVLFALHLSALADDFRFHFGRSRRFAGILFVTLALMIIPAIFTTRAVVDRITINSALEYLYEPDYKTGVRFKGSVPVLMNTLDNIRRSKSGDVIPFISEWYDFIVFGNLTLPDEKINRISYAFTGDTMKTPDNSGRLFSGIFYSRNWSPSPENDSASVSALADSTGVILSGITVRAVPGDDQFIHAAITIDMKDIKPRQFGTTEFIARIKISDGVFVSGYNLTIEGKQVPGRIFEKKTALWVYEMIRASQRDPGLLLYTGDNELLLRVFPFTGNEKRRCEIEITYPKGSDSRMSIAGRSIPLPAQKTESSILVLSEKESSALFIPSRLISGVQKIHREPYIRFIIDSSAGSLLNRDSVRKSVTSTLEKFPEAKSCSVSFADFDIDDRVKNIPVMNAAAKITELWEKKAPSSKGGFLRDRAVRHAIMTSDSSPERFPVIVVISGNQKPLSDYETGSFRRMIPDVDGYLVTDGNGFDSVSFNGRALDTIHFYKVVSLEQNGKAPLYIRADGSDQIIFTGSSAAMRYTMRQSNGTSFTAPARDIPADSLGGRALYGAELFHEKTADPSKGGQLLRRLVDESRTSGILNGATSYIVVENSAQWKTLEEVEDRKLSGKEALEVSQKSPEPPVWVMLIALALIVIFKSRRRISSFYCRANE